MSYSVRENRCDGWFQAVYRDGVGTETFSRQVDTKAEADAEIRIHAKTGAFSHEDSPEDIDHVYEAEKDPLSSDPTGSLEAMLASLAVEKRNIDGEVDTLVNQRITDDMSHIIHEVLEEVREELGGIDREEIIEKVFNSRRKEVKAGLKAEILNRLRAGRGIVAEPTWG